MKKLQQFYIMKFSSTRLDKFGYHLKRILGNSGYHIRDIRQNGELIALADKTKKFIVFLKLFPIRAVDSWKTTIHSLLKKVQRCNL